MMLLALLLAAQTSSLGTSPSVARGEKMFAQGCAVGYCHGAGGAASRGPRLRGRTFARDYLLKVTRDGIPSTAMPAWKDRLPDDDIQALVDYCMSLATAVGESGSAQAAAEPSPIKDFEGPTDVKQGRELFFDASRQSRCSTCHRLSGFGVGIAPDLAKSALARRPNLAGVLRARRTNKIFAVTTNDGETLTGLVAERNQQVVRIYDLMIIPPVLRSFAASEVRKVTPSAQWSHVAVAKEYKGRELDSIGKFLRWMATPKP